MSVPAPDLKPYVPSLPPGSEDCGCCDGITTETPQGIDNRSGLSSVDYRIGDYAKFRASVHAALASSKFKPLAELRTRDDDDFTMGLIDAFACSADVLTFYQERIANESYLRTATERVSLQEMAKLIGYRMRPGIAAETWLAFALETPRIAPPNLPAEPGAFVTGIPTELKLATGLKVQSVPGPDEKPQTFETVEEITARPEWNAIRPWLSASGAPGHGATETWVQGVANNLKVGDALVFVDPAFLANPTTNTNWDFRLIDTVVIEPKANRTHITWKGGLAHVSSAVDPPVAPQLHVLRKRAAVFGNNAPKWLSMNNEFKTNYLADTTDPNEWPSFNISELLATPTGGHTDLDAVYGEIKPGGLAILTRVGFDTRTVGVKAKFGGSGAISMAADIAGISAFSPKTFTELYSVSSTNDISLAAYALSGKVTRIGVQGQQLDTIFFNHVRETSVYAQSELLQLAPYPVTAEVSGDRIPADAGISGLLPGRHFVVRGNRASDNASVVVTATLVAAHAVSGTRCELEVSPPLAHSLARESVVVYGNVALASHGETVAQILGVGNASQTFQRFELKQSPLTCRAAENEVGSAAELTLRVSDIAWKEKPTMYGTGPTERAYTLSVDEKGRNFVLFGDGVRGSRLASGVNNVRASYRKGLGVEGNVAADKLTQLMSRPLGLKSVSNPLTAEGGNDPETAATARQNMPLGTRTLGRAVSLLDYEDFARAFSGISKAQAQVLHIGSRSVVVVTLAGPGGALLTVNSPVWQHLLTALKNGGDPHVAIQLLAFKGSSFRLGIKVKCDSDYESKTVLAAVEAALRIHYAFDARELSQPVHKSEVIAVAQAVPGVVAVDLTRLYGGTQPFSQTLVSEQVRLLASRMQVLGGAAVPAELLTLHPEPFDLLEEMT